MATPKLRPIARRLTMAPSTMSQMWAKETVASGNSSATTVSVAPAALPIPSARWPALRPIATTTYQRRVDRASSIRLRTSSAPTCRAVWKPKVGTCGGSGRSLSIVLGTWTLRIVPCERSATVRDDSAVSSPPMVTRCVMPACCSVSMTACSASADLVGFSREVPSTEPPVRCTRDTSSMVSGRSLSALRRTRFLKPSWIPMTSKPSLMASMAADEMTVLMPGAGPPPTRMPSLFPAFMDARILSAARHGVNRKRSRDMIWRSPEGSRMRFRSPLLAIAATTLALALTTTPLSGQDAPAGRCRSPTSTASATSAISTSLPTAPGSPTPSGSPTSPGQGRRRHLAVELGRHRARPPDDQPDPRIAAALQPRRQVDRVRVRPEER